MGFTEITVLILASGAMINMSNGIVYYIWRRGPSRITGSWFALSIAVLMIRGIELRTLGNIGDLGSMLVWAHVWIASLACMVSMWRQAAKANFVRSKTGKV